MLKFDKKYFRHAANEVLDDVQDGEIRSNSWRWLAVGAIVGFLTSCIKVTQDSGKPILARLKKLRDKGE